MTMEDKKEQTRLCMFYPAKQGHAVKSQFSKDDLVLCHIHGIEGRVWIPMSELPDSAQVFAVEIVDVHKGDN